MRATSAPVGAGRQRRGALRYAGFALLVLVAFGFLAAPAHNAQPGDLVAAFAFDEGSGSVVADRSGNGNAGQIGSATWTTSGKFGNALSFNGSSARVTVPDAASLRLTGAMTLEAWVFPTSVTNAWRDVVYKGDDNYYLEATSSSGSAPSVGGTFGAGGSNIVSSTALAANVWSHMAATYDGSTLRLYVNGVQVASKPQTGSLATSANPLQIGGDALYGQFFSGRIDEVRVYRAALSQAEIQADMAAPLGGPPDTAVPSQVSGLAASAVSSSRIDLSWSAASDNVGVTGYEIERCQGAGCSSFAAVTTVATLTWSDTGRLPGTSYSYRVRARDAAGNTGAYSVVATAVTPVAVDNPPSAPSNLAVSASGSSGVNLSWTAATDDNGISTYEVERCQGAGCSSFVQVTTTASTSLADTGLAASTSYSYRVRARDTGNQVGPYSNVASATTGSAPPPPSSTLVAAFAFDEGSGSVVADRSGNGNAGQIGSATWTTSGKFGNALSFNGSSARVTVPDAASLRLTGAMTLEAWVFPTSVTNAWRDVVYKGDDNYYLEATSSSGSAPSVGGTFGAGGSNIVSSTALAANVWSHMAATYDGSTLRLYVNGVQVASKPQTGSLATSANPLQIGGDALYGQFFSGRIDEVRVYRAALSQAEIQADMAAPLGGPPDTAVPSQVSGLAASAVSSSRIDLSWSAASDNVGVTGYEIERCQGAGCSSFAAVTTVATLTWSDTGRLPGTSYSYRVRARDAAGNTGAYSVVATAVTPVAVDNPPSAPSNLAVSASGSSGVNLSWTAATDDNGISTYEVERCQGAGCSSFVQVTTTASTSLADTGLAASTSYSYRVRARDTGNQVGPYSNVASATTGSAPPPPSSTLVAAFAFDEGSGSSVADLSGNGNAGQIGSASWTTSGKFGNALSFNGSSARVTVPDSASLRLTGAMTLEAWVFPTSVTNAWRDVVYKGNDNYYLMATSSSGSVPMIGGIFTGSYGEAYGAAALSANAWSHLAATYDGAALRLYVNGVQVASRAQTGSLATSANPLQIGGDSIWGQYFSGRIDEVRVYRAALSQAEIQTDMNTPIGSGSSSFPTAPANLVATTSSSTEIDLTWGASTSSVGVAGYRVERCQGAGCTSFLQIASPTGTSYNDTSLAAATSYTYRVRAIDTAGTLGPYSSAATAVTVVTGVLVTPRQVSLTPGLAQQYSASVSGGGGVTWSVDGVVGGSSNSGTITAAGLYTAPAQPGTHTITARTTDGSLSGDAAAYITNYAGKFTFHNDNLRTGQNLQERVLSPANVNSTSFGKLFDYQLDGYTFASPLYVPNVTIPGQGIHNVVYVATEHDSVFAFDADGRSSAPLWHVSFINPGAGVTPIPPAETGENEDIPNEIGITGTPVIDPSTNTLYLVAATKEVGGGTRYVNRLHALDLATGAEKFGGPVIIDASVPGTGVDAVGGRISFNNVTENQRPALLQVGGEIYVAFANHGFNPPYHGWVMAYNATTLHQDWAFCTTPNAQSGGVWMGGDGVAADGSGFLYFSTGNGTFDANQGRSDYGDTLLKLNPNGTVADYFTPYNYATLDSQDIDLASGGVILLPDQPGSHPHEVIAAGKGGTVYLVDRDNMGHVGSGSNNQIVQSLVNVFPTGGSYNTGNYSAPTYFSSTVYFAPVKGPVMAFSLTNGRLSTSPTSQSTAIFDGKTSTFSARGGETSISANGNTNGILWALQSNGDSQPGTLHAYDPADLTHEYYTSDQAGSRDRLDPWLKFTTPLIANGHVYVVSAGRLTAFGLLP